jgi:large subunit ribosomal protein L15
MRVGRGIGSGKGKTSGKGQKGQKSRSGVALNGFEGGQMPLYRKLPHRGFNNKNFTIDYSVVNVGDLARIDEAVSDVTFDVLVKHGLVRGNSVRVKILGNGEISRALNVTAGKFSASAKEKIEKAGGQAITA